MHALIATEVPYTETMCLACGVELVQYKLTTRDYPAGDGCGPMLSVECRSNSARSWARPRASPRSCTRPRASPPNVPCVADVSSVTAGERADKLLDLAGVPGIFSQASSYRIFANELRAMATSPSVSAPGVATFGCTETADLCHDRPASETLGVVSGATSPST